MLLTVHSDMYPHLQKNIFAVCLGAHGRYAQKLMSDLFSNYTSALRPVEDTEHIINVTLQITLSQIIDMVTPELFAFTHTHTHTHSRLNTSLLISAALGKLR